DIEIHFRGTVHRIGGNGFCGCSRATLLKILGRRARSLGVDVRYQTEVSPLDPAILDADLVVAADGINSRFRETFSDQFQPSIDSRPNLFSWMGSTRPFDEAASARFVEDLFAPELEGHRIITNRSIWRNFPTVRCERWVAGNVVLIGDAK